MEAAQILKNLWEIYHQFQSASQVSLARARFTNAELDDARHLVQEFQSTLSALRQRLELAGRAEMPYENAVPDDEVAGLCLAAIRHVVDDNVALAHDVEMRRHAQRLMDALTAISIDRNYARREV